jgi:VWFA-related protein
MNAAFLCTALLLVPATWAQRAPVETPSAEPGTPPESGGDDDEGVDHATVAFTGEVEQVTVDVVVTSKDGAPVTGLTLADFSVFDEGEAKAVSYFEEIHHPGPEPSEPLVGVPQRPRVVTNRLPPQERGRTFLIVFDNIHMSPLGAEPAKAAVVAFLEKGVSEGDQVSLLATGGDVWWGTRMNAGRADLIAILNRLDGLRVREHATERMTDHEASRIFLYEDTNTAQRVEKRFAHYGTHSRQGLMNSTEETRQTSYRGQIDGYVMARAKETYFKLRARMGVTLGLLERALVPLAKDQSRKSIILISEGFVYDPSHARWKRVIESARRANASVYFVDTTGLAAMSAIYSAEFISSRGDATAPTDLLAALADVSQEGEGSHSLAADTGGFSIRNSNGFAQRAARIGQESRSYYLLGYAPGDIPHDGKFRKINVKVRGKDIEVHFRKGYYAPSLDPVPEAPLDKGTDVDLQRALDSTASLDEIPIRMTSYVLEESMLGKVRAMIVADVDLSQIQFQDSAGKPTGTMDTLLVLSHRDSGEVQRTDQTVELSLKQAVPDTPSWYSLVRQFDVPSGGYQARLVVRDNNSARVGTVVLEFEVQDPDGLRITTPILTDTLQPAREEGAFVPVPLARRTFSRAEPLYCRFDVYGMERDADGMPAVTAGHQVRRTEGGVALSEAPTRITPTSLGAVGRRIGISLAGIEPGEYDLVLTVKDELSGASLESTEPFTVVADRAAVR